MQILRTMLGLGNSQWPGQSVLVRAPLSTLSAGASAHRRIGASAHSLNVRTLALALRFDGASTQLRRWTAVFRGYCFDVEVVLRVPDPWQRLQSNSPFLPVPLQKVQGELDISC